MRSRAAELNRSYRELARHYGFKVDPTPAYEHLGARYRRRASSRDDRKVMTAACCVTRRRVFVVECPTPRT